MGRKKVGLQWITNDSSRRATLNKRCKALMKKTSDLVALCGVKACVLVFGENEVQPRVWPSNTEATDLLTRFKATAGLEQWNKKTSHEEFLGARITKLKDQVSKSNLQSQERETLILLHETAVGSRPGLVGVPTEEVTRLRDMVERKKESVLKRLQRLGVEPVAHPEPELPRPQLPPRAPYTFTGMHGQATVEPQLQQQNMLMNTAWGPREPSGMAYGAFAGNSSGAGPSSIGTSRGGGNIMQPYHHGSSGLPWPGNSFPPME